MPSFNLPARTLPAGDTMFGPFAVPIGTQQIEMTLDVTNLLPTQRVWLKLEYFDGATWRGSLADFSGPWHDKAGVLHNDVNLKFDFGGVAVNGVLQPRVSGAGWQARVTFTVEGGPYDTAGGTLLLT